MNIIQIILEHLGKSLADSRRKRAAQFLSRAEDLEELERRLCMLDSADAMRIARRERVRREGARLPQADRSDHRARGTAVATGPAATGSGGSIE